MSRFDAVLVAACVVAIVSIPLARRYEQFPIIEWLSIGALLLSAVLAGVRGYLMYMG
jgi:hypothetical protein